MQARRVSVLAVVLVACAGGPAAGAQPTLSPGSGPAASPAPVQWPAATTGAPIYLRPGPDLPAGCDPQQCNPTCNERPAAPFIPYMLGDALGLLANQFSDVKIAEGE